MKTLQLQSRAADVTEISASKCITHFASYRQKRFKCEVLKRNRSRRFESNTELKNTVRLHVATERSWRQQLDPNVSTQ